MDKISQEEKEKALREILFIPCETKEHLHAWVKAYLDLDLPSSTVCHTDTDFEPSNSNPMDLLWEVYDSARRGDRTKSRYLYYAARGSYKSVLASVIEILCLFHLRRDVGHMAANKHQSKVVQKYLKNYLKRPVLRDYMTSKNDSEVSVAWYENSDGGKLTPDQYKVLLENNPSVAKEYIEKSYLVTIVVATLGGTNSLHVSMLIMDELDLTPAEVISEAMLIPANGKEYGEPPMVLMTSSRKFALGPVQDALDNAHKTGTHIRHWNVLDVTAKSLDGDTILFPCNQNPKKLKEFKVGDLVYGVNNLGQTIQTKVLALYDHGTLDAFEVTFNDGYRVVCSKDHRFLTPLGQLPLEEIVENGLEVFCGRSEKRWGLEDLLRTKFSNKKGIRQTSSAGVSNLSCGWSGSSSCQEEKVVARQSEKSTRSSMFSVECLKILEGEESRKREDQDKQVSGGSKALEKGKPRGSQGCNRPYAPRRQTMGKSQSRQGSRESAENANCTKVICFEARTLASGFWNTDLGASPNSLRQESQASGLRVARPFYMGGGRWVLPLLCPQESTERYWCAIEERSVTRHDVEPRVYSPRQRDADSAVDGILQQQDGRTKAGMGEVAWEYAPLASTRGLVLRKIVSVVSVGKRRMYDLGVAHPKHNFLLPNGVVTSNCHPTRHLPERPRLKVFYSNEQLTTIEEKAHKDLPEEARKDFKEDQAFEGCVKNCKMFAMCRGRLATEQKSESSLLKHVADTQELFASQTDIEKVQAQLLCFAAGTQILMGDGTCKGIEDILVGDEVVTHTGKIRKVTETFVRRHEGLIYEVKHPTWQGFGETRVTAEHPYFVNGKEFKEISGVRKSSPKGSNRLKPNDYLSLPRSYEYDSFMRVLVCSDYIPTKKVSKHRWVYHKTGRTEGRSLPNKIPLNYDFGWFLGYFLAEGHSSSRRRGGQRHPTSITLSSHCAEVHFHKRVKDFAASLGLTAVPFKCKEGNGVVHVINNAALSHLVTALCGELCDKKRLHPRLINGKLPFLKGVLEGFWSGDGTKRLNSYRELTTTSYNLATQLFLIASRFGYCPRIKKKPLDPGQKKPAYLVVYQNPDWESVQVNRKFRRTVNNNLYRLDEVSKSSFSGSVHNIEVEDDHSYIANGVSVHNCWRPSRAGMIYPRMSRVSHMLSAAQIASMITGEEYPSTFGKRELINFFATQEVRYYVGIDHGFNHCFAGVLGVKVGGLMFIIDAFEIPGLELDGKIRLMDSRFKKFDPVVFADTSHPGDNKSIGKAGFKMRKWTKGPGSVVDGIGVVRMKLNPVLGKRPELYFLAGDPGVEVLFERMLKYAWVIDTNTGEPTNEPNEKDDDGCDATRYMVMNVFAPKGSFKGSVGVGDEERARNPVMGLVDPNVSDKAKKTMVRQQNWSQVLQHIGFPQDSKPITREDESGEPSPKRRGGLIFDLG